MQTSKQTGKWFDDWQQNRKIRVCFALFGPILFCQSLAVSLSICISGPDCQLPSWQTTTKPHCTTADFGCNYRKSTFALGSKGGCDGDGSDAKCHLSDDINSNTICTILFSTKIGANGGKDYWKNRKMRECFRQSSTDSKQSNKTK